MTEAALSPLIVETYIDRFEARSCSRADAPTALQRRSLPALNRPAPPPAQLIGGTMTIGGRYSIEELQGMSVKDLVFLARQLGIETEGLGKLDLLVLLDAHPGPHVEAADDIDDGWAYAILAFEDNMNGSMWMHFVGGVADDDDANDELERVDWTYGEDGMDGVRTFATIDAARMFMSDHDLGTDWCYVINVRIDDDWHLP
jgi:hypothetical protein